VITVTDYFGKWANHKDATPERYANARKLVVACSVLQSVAEQDGVRFPTNPVTGTGISGSQYGGFRPQECPDGAPHSAHKEALAMDRYDPDGEIDTWCMENQDKLEACGIYIEHPSTTSGWSHWTIRAPHSGHTVFYP